MKIGLLDSITDDHDAFDKKLLEQALKDRDLENYIRIRRLVLLREIRDKLNGLSMK